MNAPARGAATQAAFAAALLDPALPCPTGLRAWNGSDPTARLAVYRNNVISSLTSALAETFPVVRELVGGEFFAAMAGVFVRESPPPSRLLAQYGQALPEFIERFAPARPLPYLADLARLEFARVAAYHAADADPVDQAVVGVALASGERIGELRLQCQPSLGSVDSPYAVVSIWAAHQRDTITEPIATDPAQAALVVREGLDVLVLPVDRGAVAFVRALQQGDALGNAAGGAVQADAAFDLASTLALLLGHGAITSIHLPPRSA